MDLASIIADIKLAVSAAQAAYQLGKDAKPFIDNAASIIGGTPMTPDQRTVALAQEAALRARLQAPITDD